MPVAAIDIGTNSFLCLIAQKNHGQLEVLEDQVEIVRLGEGVHTNRCFSPAALERAEHCFSRFQKLFQKYEVEKIQGVATSASRDVQNAQDFLNLGQIYNIPIEIISGEREAELTYKGVATGPVPTEPYMVVDIGGGSTEFAWIEKGQVQLQSLDIGCVRLTETHAGEEAVNKLLGQLGTIKIQNVVAVAGTATTLASVLLQQLYNVEKIEATVFQQQQLEDLYNKIRPMSLDEIKQLPGMEPKRADVIVAGLLILKQVLKALGAQNFQVSCRGIRFGLAQEMLGL